MDAAFWLRVQAALDGALERPAEEREAFLRAQCGGDHALLEEATSLLAKVGSEDALLPQDGRGLVGSLLAADRATVGLAPGVVFGHYRIERLLGVGGMGEVYLARDDRLQRKVALKLLSGCLDLDPRMVERFRKEALAASALRHPHIPVVFEAGVQDGRHFIAAEYIEGETLSQRLRRGPPLDWRAAAGIAETVARALAAAHASGIVHRDVKPGNILLDALGRPHLVDFGIAKAIRAPTDAGDSGSALTVAGAQLGTPGYMAPEQFFGEDVGPTADVWSLAAVLYEMVTGKPPAAGTQATRARRGVPVQLGAVLEQALREDPRKRFPDAGALADALAAATRCVWCARLSAYRGWLLALAAAMAAAGVLLSGSLWRIAGPPGPPSLAVLPFENLSADRSDDYFALGIEDEMLTRLARVSGLRVLDRHASERAVKSGVNLSRLADQLGVGHVLEGSVQRQDGRVLVHVRLIDAATQAQQWAERYERDARDVFSIERDVAEGVAAQLSAQVRAVERVAVAIADTASPEAHEAALRGRYLYRKGDAESLKQAVALLEQAVRLDPRYAQAFADLAMARHNLDDFTPDDRPDNRARARTAAQRALALAPDLTDGHVALGWMFELWDWDLDGARREFEAADALAPNSPRAINGLAVLTMNLGEFVRARGLFEHARKLDPLSGTTSINMANLTLAMGELEATEGLAREALRLEPGLANCHANLARIALQRGRLSEAASEARLEPAADWRDYLLAAVDQRQLQRAEADASMRRFEQGYAVESPFLVAALHARRGEIDQTLAWLERAARLRDAGTIELLVAPEFGFLHSDPRFQAFCRRIGLPSAPHPGTSPGAVLLRPSDSAV